MRMREVRKGLSEIFGSEVGDIVQDVARALDNRNMDDVLTSLAILMAFAIDSMDDKKDEMERAFDLVSKMVSLDKPAFRDSPSRSNVQH